MWGLLSNYIFSNDLSEDHDVDSVKCANIPVTMDSDNTLDVEQQKLSNSGSTSSQFKVKGMLLYCFYNIDEAKGFLKAEGYKFKRSPRKTDYYYDCIKHSNCGSRMHLKHKIDLLNTSYELFQYGNHSETLDLKRTANILCREHIKKSKLLPKADVMLTMRSEVEDRLNLSWDEANLFCLSDNQVKSALTRLNKPSIQVDAVADIVDFIRLNIVEFGEDYVNLKGIVEGTDLQSNFCIYLHIYVGQDSVSNQSLLACNLEKQHVLKGFTFTSKACLANLKDSITAARTKGTKLALYLDGTYKLVNNGWVLLSLIVTQTVIKNKEIRHSPRPIMFMLAYSESKNATECLLKSAEYAASLVDERLSDVLGGVMIDHSDPFNAGIESIYGENKSLSCYFHMVKRVRDYGNTTLFDAIIHKHLFYMHLCRTRNDFDKLSELCLSIWTDLNYSHSNKFSQSYLKSPHSNWYLGAYLSEGFGSTNNVSESFNKVIKNYIQNSASMSKFLSDNILRLMELIAVSYSNTNKDIVVVKSFKAIDFLNQHSIHSNVVKAVKIKLDSSSINIKKVNASKYYVNSSYYSGVAITEDRINARDMHILYGELTSMTVDEKYLALAKTVENKFSLHEVMINNGKYVCSCKSFVNFGLPCSHICVVLHSSKEFPMSNFFEGLDQPKKAGRPRKRPPALVRSSLPSILPVSF